jgi:nucleotide sugar dehydrogenase
MKIAVIGLGYIGISTAIYFTKAEIDVIGIDVDVNKINSIRKGELPQKDLQAWLDFDTKPYLEKVKASSDISCLNQENLDAIFIAVPTEKDGLPWFNALETVIVTLRENMMEKNLIIVESTLTPGVAEKYLKPYLSHYALAPRRDWFTDKGKTIETLPRIVGGSDYETTLNACKIIGRVCKTIHSCTAQEAELVKAVENSIRHVGAVYATELAIAYPNLNIRKILKLASSKWNVPEYYPNILGTSGYCIPISSKYVQMGAEFGKDLTILEEVLSTDKIISQLTADAINRSNPKKIGILGMAYLGDIKVHIECGCLRLVKHLVDSDIEINDPLYTSEEILEISGKKSFSLSDIDKYDVIILTAGHSAYRDVNKEEIIGKTKNCKYILDNSENSVWKDIEFKCPYIIPGEAEWLNKIK